MRFLVVGTGSIGRRHARNLLALGHEVSGWDASSRRLDETRRAIPGFVAATGMEAALGGRPDAVLVCTPPATHVAVARQAVDAGCHVFVEKPVAHASDEVPALLDAAKRAGRILAVGFNLRFLPSLRRVKALLEAERIGRVYSARVFFGSYLPSWRPGRDYQDNYAVSAAQGGGVLLDAIHELDYLAWLFGEAAELCCAASHLSALAGDTEDLAEVTVRFASGTIAQVHLDYLRRAYRRDLEIVGADGVITWDFVSRAVRALGPEPDPVELHDGESDAPNEAMYVEEMRHFIRCLEGAEEPMVDGWEALRSLRMVEAAKIAAAERRWVSL
jgi:predicted dehydrogenase